MESQKVKDYLFMKRLWCFFLIIWWFFSLVYMSKFRFKGRSWYEKNQMLSAKARALLATLHMHIEASNLPDNQPALYASNHITWLDMLAISSIQPVSYVAKKEIRQWPLIGDLTASVGSIYVDRNNKLGSEAINQAMAEALQQGQSIAFFPEAKTSEDGINMHPLRAALFRSAQLAKVPIRPLAISYYDASGQRTAQVSYGKGISLARCIWSILSVRELTIRLDFLAEIDVNKLKNDDIYVIKDHVEQAILTALPAGTKMINNPPKTSSEKCF